MADIRDSVKTYDMSKSKSGEVLNPQWWMIDNENMYKHVRPVIDKIEAQQSARRKRSLFFARLYENEELLGFQAGMYQSTDSLAGQSNRLTLNVIKSCTDTLVSKLGTAKPKPMALTHNGDWPKQKRAEKLSDYLEGLYDNIGLWKKGRLSQRDSCVLGTGAIKLFTQDGKIGADRIIIDEIIVDEVEAMYGEPRQMHQRKYMTKEVLKALFKDHVDMIDMCDSGMTSETKDRSTADMLLVYESWHLPSGKDKKDGKHCITITNCTLFCEEWTKDWFPFLFLRYTDKLLGFYGRSLSEEISGIQLEINKLLRNIAIAQHLMAAPQVWLNVESKNVAAQMNNMPGALRYYTGTPPIFMTPGAMSAEIYQHLETLYRRAFEITGISQLSAQGAKPGGITANSALRTLQDIESDRFKWTSQKYEEMYIDAARKIVELNDDLFAQDKKLAVSVQGKKGIKKINWADVRMDLEDFSLRLYPSSLLPSEPAGQLQTVQELIQGQMVTREEGMSMMDFPDVKAVTSLKTASRDVAMMMIGEMMEDGKYSSPEPYMQLELARDLAQTSYLKYRAEGAPSANLDLLLTFIDDCQAMIDAAAPQIDPNAALAADPMAAAGDPLAQGASLPESELLPFAS